MASTHDNQEDLPEELTPEPEVIVEGREKVGGSSHRKTYTWRPDRILVRCSCEEEMRAQLNQTVCSQCNRDHTSLVREVKQHFAANNIKWPTKVNPVVEESGTFAARKVIYAEKIISELSKDTSDEQLADTNAHGSAEADYSSTLTSVLYQLRNAIVIGELNLKYWTVERALDINNCWFLSKVNLQYCKFKQAVNFRQCTFFQDVDSGTEFESLTVYDKDLNCSRAVFKKAVSFNGAQVKGSAYFNESVFEFRGLDESKDFDSPADCTVDFTFASFGKYIDCSDALFEGATSFNSINCDGTGRFNGAKFKHKDGPDFRYASFGINLRCKDCEFEGTARFNAIKCGYSGFFENAQFTNEEQSVTFEDAHFELGLHCSGAEFEGKADFRTVRCNGLGEFFSALFKKPQANNEDRSTQVDFRFSYFGDDLDLRRTYFAGNVVIGQARIIQKLRLGGAYFKRGVELYDCSIKTLELLGVSDQHSNNYYPITIRTGGEQSKLCEVVKKKEDLEALLKKGQSKVEELAKKIFPFKKKQALDLTDTTFTRFHGGSYQLLSRTLAAMLLEAQDPQKFSRDPYSHLEGYFRSVGDEVEAKNIHYKSHVDLRKNARLKNGRTKWTWKKTLGDWLLDTGIGYGHRAWRLLLPVIAFVLIGTIVFWADDALVVTPDKTTTLPAPADSSNLAEKRFERPAYSLDLLIPVLDLRYGMMWVPNPEVYQPWREIRAVYAVVHALVGWALIAVILAWLAGIIKTE